MEAGTPSWTEGVGIAIPWECNKAEARRYRQRVLVETQAWLLLGWRRGYGLIPGGTQARDVRWQATVACVGTVPERRSGQSAEARGGRQRLPENAGASSPRMKEWAWLRLEVLHANVTVAYRRVGMGPYKTCVVTCVDNAPVIDRG